MGETPPNPIDSSHSVYLRAMKQLLRRGSRTERDSPRPALLTIDRDVGPGGVGPGRPARACLTSQMSSEPTPQSNPLIRYRCRAARDLRSETLGLFRSRTREELHELRSCLRRSIHSSDDLLPSVYANLEAGPIGEQALGSLPAALLALVGQVERDALSQGLESSSRVSPEARQPGSSGTSAQ